MRVGVLSLLWLFISTSGVQVQALQPPMIKADHVEVRLITAPHAQADKLNIGVHFKIDPEWHVYWKNPGDSGAAPKFNLTGAKINEIKWPYPHRLPVGHLTNYGYDNEVVFLIEVDSANAAADLTLNLEWLVCKVECIPGFGEFKFTKTSLPTDTELYNKFLARVPAASEKFSAKFLSRDDDTLTFELTPTTLKLDEIKNLFVYPENGMLFKTDLPKIEPQQRSLRITLPLASNSAPETANNAADSNAGEPIAIVLEKTNGETISFTKSINAQKPQASWLMGLLLAFLGGIILNLMPCVFPVLFLKAFGFLKESDSRKVKSSSWAYSLGVVLSFFAIGAVLAILRYSGESVGWGFQLQSSWVVYSLATLFFLMALNFYGYFEIGNSTALAGGKLLNHKFFSGSFGTGVLAVIVASPCTAPFMGSALGLTLLLPAYQSLAIFVALGIGMALPMLILGYIPWLINKLPRSGQWMITVKQLMAFPLFATCIWLLWVLANQKGSDAVFVSLVSFLIIVFAIWLMHSSKKLFWQTIAIILLATPVFAAVIINNYSTGDTQKALSAWAPFDEQKIAEMREQQRPIFIDFTASWCITCQVNKRAVLDTDEIQKLFNQHNVFLIRADWTNHDPKITNALAQFGRNSVPFYVFYNKMQKAQTLPELLTKDMIKELFEGEK